MVLNLLHLPFLTGTADEKLVILLRLVQKRTFFIQNGHFSSTDGECPSISGENDFRPERPGAENNLFFSIG